MLIDCQTCVARDLACDDCVVTVLLRRPQPAEVLEFDVAEQEAIDRLSRAGLVPPLRLVHGMSGNSQEIA